ncbi:MAG TPA: hypothetical protein VHB69_03665 [Mycobacteriales bacterium]|nr:hypothetical protein [Mycobacteriales bacterium]
MSDITELFQAIGPDGTGDPAAATVDGDLLRGRGALVKAHRRAVVRRSMLATGTLVVAAAVAVTATQVGGSGTTAAGGKSEPTQAVHRSHHTASAVKLVDWTGAQLNGFTVDEVPAGWHLSTSTQSALLITPDGSTNNDPDVFVDKLTVLLASTDEQSFPKDGQQVTVNGRPGVVWNGGEEMLGYTDAAGHRVVVQAPDALHWTADQLVAFAEGVHVTSNAVAGVG